MRCRIALMLASSAISCPYLLECVRDRALGNVLAIDVGRPALGGFAVVWGSGMTR